MRAPLVVAILAVVATGCPGDDGGEGGGQRVSLVSAEDWMVIDAGTDPLTDHRPPDVSCPESEYGPELTGFEVETGACNYFMASQPTRADVFEGGEISIQVAHYDLAAETEAEAHVAIVLGEQVIWEATEPIPSPAQALSGEWIADRDYPAGTPIYFHLHNHGYNTWQLYDVSTNQ